MADRFHFNPDTGRTGKCDAKVKCRFGQSDGEHGATREEARANYEKTMESELIPSAESNGANDPHRDLDWEELSPIKDRFRQMHFRDDNTTYHLWTSHLAEIAAVRGELEARGIDSSHFSERQLTEGNYYYLSDDGDRIARVFHNQNEAEREGWGQNKFLKSRDVTNAAEERIKAAVPGDSYHAVRMAQILDEEKAHGYPKPVKRHNRYTEAQLDSEAAEFEQEYRYSVADMVEMRGLTEQDLDDADLEYDGWVTVKIPSYSEADFSTELARRELAKLEEERRAARRRDASRYGYGRMPSW